MSIARMIRIGGTIGLVMALSACAPPDSSTYARSDIGRVATVMKGKILSMRSVKLSGTQTGIGAGAGAVAGGVGASGIGGGGRANTVAAVGGAVVGGLAGAVAEEAMTKSMATEFIVQQENGQTVAIVQPNDDNLAVGDKVMILRSGTARIIRDTSTR
jgi:outer membrane lipoprotein SlyB